MKTALITGTTSGIGKAFAEKFASMGNNIILVSRNEEKLKRQQNDLQSHYHVSVKYIACDLTQANAVDLIFKELNHYGRIVNVGSTGSFIPSPSDAVYSATKAYIMSFSNALYGELKRTGIKVTLLCPGATETEFAAKANIQNTMLFKYAVMKPEKVAAIAYPKLMSGKRLVIPGIYNKF